MAQVCWQIGWFSAYCATGNRPRATRTAETASTRPRPARASRSVISRWQPQIRGPQTAGVHQLAASVSKMDTSLLKPQPLW
jgi:hypothetical protein